MKIDINDDFETVFQNEAFAGFTVKQCIAAGAGLAAGFGSALALRRCRVPMWWCRSWCRFVHSVFSPIRGNPR